MAISLSLLVLLILAMDGGAAVNVALLERGATCRASSEHPGGFTCEKALDGITSQGHHEWASRGEGVGAWIEIELADVFEINSIRIMQRCSPQDQSKTLLLTFDGGRTQKVTLKEGGSSQYCSNASWEEFPVNDVCSRTVRIQTTSIYTSTNNGFLEVEVISDRMCLSKNVASTRMGATCTASSQLNAHWGCEKAIDGLAVNGWNAWATHAEGAGAWILIEFNDMYDLRRAHFMQRLLAVEQFKDLLLEFDSDTSQQVTLTQRNGTSANLEQGRWWDKFDLEPVCSTFVRITALNVYTTTNNGFQEIEFYATHQFCGCQ